MGPCVIILSRIENEVGAEEESERRKVNMGFVKITVCVGSVLRVLRRLMPDKRPTYRELAALPASGV